MHAKKYGNPMFLSKARKIPDQHKNIGFLGINSLFIGF